MVDAGRDRVPPPVVVARAASEAEPEKNYSFFFRGPEKNYSINTLFLSTKYGPRTERQRKLGQDMVPFRSVVYHSVPTTVTVEA